MTGHPYRGMTETRYSNWQGTPEALKRATYDPREQDEILVEFLKLLKLPTQDGGRKREANTKPSWKVDPAHKDGIYSHLNRYERGELQDPDSGAHPLVHLAWRALAQAYQETRNSST